MSIIVGSTDCPTVKIVCTLSTSEHFGLLTKKWSDVSRELGTSSAKIIKLRNDIFLDKLSTSDVLSEILDDWVARRGSEANLRDLLTALKKYNLNVLEDLLKKTFLHPATSTTRKYSRPPTGLHDFLSQTKKPNSICIILSVDLSITCDKIKDNLKQPPIQTFEEFFELLSNFDSDNDFEKIYFVKETEMKQLTKIIFAILSTNETIQGDPIRTVLLTRVENEKELLRFITAHVPSKQEVTIITDNPKWEDLTPLHANNIVKQLEGTLQVELEHHELSELLQERVLIDLINGKGLQLFHETIPPNLSYYVSRTVLARDSISTEVFHSNTEDLILVSGLLRYELSGFVKDHITDNSSNQLRLAKVTVKYMILDHPSHFNRICELTPNPVHWLRCHDKRFRWVSSRGSMATLKNFVEDQKQYYLKEGTFCKELGAQSDSNRPVLISDSPGMGKTVLLAEIGHRLEEIHPQRLVFFLTLSEVVKQMKEGLIEDKASAFKQLLERTLCRHVWGKGSLSSKLNYSGNIEIEMLLDGFDEVDPKDSKLALDLLQTIQTELKSIRLWITSRPHFLEKLEESLSTLGYNIKPFSHEDQLTFLTSYWSRDKTSNLDEGKLIKYAGECLKILRSKMNTKDDDITGIPLQCLLIGEVYEEEAIHFQENVAAEFIVPTIFISSVTDLFKCLIVKKFQKYFTAHVNEDSSGTHILIDMHFQLSIELIFPEHFESLRNRFEYDIKMEEVLKVGILEMSSLSSSATPRFIHRTFAEYFTAWFVMNMLKDASVTGSFLQSILDSQDTYSNKLGMDSFRFTHTAINYFLNSLITDALAIPLHSSKEQLESLLKSPEDIRKVAHSCVNEDHVQLFNFFQKLFEQNGKLIFNKEFLLLSIEKASLDIVKWSLISMVSYHKFDLAEQTQVLRHAVKMGEYSTVEYFVNERKLRRIVELFREGIRELLHDCVAASKINSDKEIENKIAILCLLTPINSKLMEEKNGEGRTPLLSKGIHIRLLLELIRLGAEVLARDEASETVLHLRRGDRDNLTCDEYQSLVAVISPGKLRKLLRVRGSYGHTPLIRLVEEIDPQIETLRIFKDSGADFGCKDDSQVPLIEIAIKKGRNAETLRELLEYGDGSASNLLHIAAEFGNVGAVKILIDEQGRSANAKDADGLTPLDYLIKSKFKQGEIFKTGLALHDRGAKFKEVINSKGQSWLHLSAESGNLQAVEFLLHILVDVNIKDKDLNTPLHLVVANSDPFKISIIKILLENYANFSSLNSQQETPFQLALRNPNMDLDTLLLLKSNTRIQWNPPLATATLKRVIQLGKNLNEEEFSALMLELGEHGADFNYKDDDGNLVHVAVENTHEKALHFLVSHRTSINATNKWQRTPLHMAAQTQNFKDGFKAMKYLIGCDADVLARDLNNTTFLHNSLGVTTATPLDCHEMVEFLVEKDLSSLFNIPGGFDQMTPLHWFVRDLELEERTLSVLHSAGADFNAVTRTGVSVFGFAVEHERTPGFLSKLISFGANPTATSNSKVGVLHLAAKFGSLSGLKFLLELGIYDVNACNENGDTPLHSAVAQRTMKDVVEKCKQLIAHGADDGKVNKKGYVPLKYAQEMRNDELYKELESIMGYHPKVVSQEDQKQKVATLKTIMQMVESGHDMFSKDEKGYNPIHNFVVGGDATPASGEFHAICEYLATKSLLTLLNCPGGENEATTLQYALLHLEVTMATLALLHGSCEVNFNALDKHGDSLLSYAIRGGRSLQLLSSLINSFGGDLIHLNNKKENLLHIAATDGKVEALEFLLELKVLDINGADGAGLTPLHTAWMTPNKDVLEKFAMLISHGADINLKTKDNKQYSPLHFAAYYYEDKTVSLKLIRYLIANGADPLAKAVDNITFLHVYLAGIRDPTPSEFHAMVDYLESENLCDLFKEVDARGQTPLHLAVLYLEPEEATLILIQSHGVNFNAADIHGRTILEYAVNGRRTKPFLSTLITRFGADPKKLSTQEEGILHTVGQIETADSLQFFLALDCLEVNGQDKYGFTPLNRVVRYSEKETLEKCRLLVDSGADVNLPNQWRQAPLHSAVAEKESQTVLKIMKFLIEQGADVFAKDHENRTFIHMYLTPAISKPSTAEVHSLFDYLVSKNYARVLNTPGGKVEATPMQLFVQQVEPQDSTLGLLHSRGVNFNAVDKHGDSLLFYAIMGNRRREILNDLIHRFGADHKVINNEGSNILHIAASVVSGVTALELFLDLGGVDLNGGNKEGNTSLHIAVSSNRGNVVDAVEKCRLLVSKGANTSILNNEGQTPLAIAKEVYHKGENVKELHGLLEPSFASK